MGIATILLIIAFLLFVADASGRIRATFNLTAAGLACGTLAMLIGVLG